MSAVNLNLNSGSIFFQELVFKRWINYILIAKNVQIENLYSDLADGIHIVHLIEALTSHEFKAKIKSPNFRSQKMENITMALRYLQENENIKFINIDSSNILDMNSKLILCFIWHIVEYFSITKPLELYFKLNNVSFSIGKSTKQRFSNWLKLQLPVMNNIYNFRTLINDIQDGKLIGALVNRCESSLCSDWEIWPSFCNESLPFITTAMEAGAAIGIPQFITPIELFNSKPDEQSLMTYLSQFIIYQINKITLVNTISASNVIINGIDKKYYSIFEAVSFCIEFPASKTIQIKLTEPNGDISILKTIESQQKRDILKQDFIITPQIVGEYTVTVFSGKSNSVVTETSFIVSENSEESDDIDLDSLLNFKGRGLQPCGVRVGDVVSFSIQIYDAIKLDPSHVLVTVKYKDGKYVDMTRKDEAHLIFCQYAPLMVGIHEIMVSIRNTDLEKLFKINISEKYTTQIVAFGHGLKWGCVNESALFIVETNGESGTLNFTIEGPNEANIECKDNGDGSASVSFLPLMVGEYAVHILYDDEDIKNSPFMVEIFERNSNIRPNKVKAYGPALCEGCLTVGQQATFTVDLTHTRGTLDQLTIDCFDRLGKTLPLKTANQEPNKLTCSVLPTSSVKLNIFISLDGVSIKGTPFMIYVVENSLSSKVRVQGPGIQSVISGKESQFFIDCRLLFNSSKSSISTPSQVNGDLQKVYENNNQDLDSDDYKKIDVLITDSNLNQIPCLIEPTKGDKNIFCVSYIPNYNISRCLIDVIYDKIAVFDEPLIVPVSDNEDHKHLRDKCSNFNKVIETGDQVPNNYLSKKLLPDFSDIFLDPKAENYLKMIVPPDSVEIESTDLPLPPPDLIDDTGDNNALDYADDQHNFKFPLSTVYEESEENCSVRDSIFSSECVSRSSQKEELISLSRRSSFTLCSASPVINPIGNHMKPDTTLYQLPTIPRESSSEENLAIENTPFPEPPSDTLLACWSTDEVILKFGEVDDYYLNEEIIDILLSPLKVNKIRILTIETKSRFDSLLEFQTILFSLGLSQMLLQTSNEHYSINKAEIFDNRTPLKYQPEKLVKQSLMRRESCDISFSEVMPVTQMDIIMSPFDAENISLSDNSSQASEDSLMNSDSLTPTSIYSSCNSKQLKKANTQEFEGLSLGNVELFNSTIYGNCSNLLSIVITKPTQLFNKNHFCKREFTTSEISEISDTSQWVSVNENCDIRKTNLNNYNNDDCSDDFSDNIKTFSMSNNPTLYARNSIVENNNHDVGKTVSISDSNNQRRKSTELDIVSLSDGKSAASASFPEPPPSICLAQIMSNNTKELADLNCDINHNLTLEEIYNDKKHKRVNSGKSECTNLLSDCPSKLESVQLKHQELQLSQPNTITYLTNNLESGTLLNTEHYCKQMILRTSFGKLEDQSRSIITNSQQSRRRSKSINLVNDVNEDNNYLDSQFRKFDYNHLGRFDDQRVSNCNSKWRSLSQSYASFLDNDRFFEPAKLNSLRTDGYGSVKYSSSELSNYPHEFIDNAENYNRPKSGMSWTKNKDKYERKLQSANDARIAEHPLNDELSQPIFLSNQMEMFNRKPLIANKTVSNLDLGEIGGAMKNITSACNRLDKVHASEFVLSLEDKEQIGEMPQQSIYVYGDGIANAFVHEASEFFIRTRGLNTAECVSLSIEGPSKIQMETTTLSNGDTQVHYIPVVAGEYTLNIHIMGRHITGSPYKILVRNREDKMPKLLSNPANNQCTQKPLININKVYAEGSGLTDALVNISNVFNIFTKNAGPGGLSLSIEGPSKAIIEFKDAKNGACGVSYIVSEAGLYTCIVKFNKKHIRGSPFSINVKALHTPPVKDVNNEQKPSGFPQNKLTYCIGKKIAMKIRLTDLNVDENAVQSGLLRAILLTSSGTRHDIKLIYEYLGAHYLIAEFTPEETGECCLNIYLGLNTVTPLRVYEISVIETSSNELMASGVEDNEKSRFHKELESILVFGKGLVSGKAGVSNIFFIEIGESVSGALNVTVDGPSKVEIKCTETEKGFKFSYIPAVPGDYTVTIKYGGETQIKGSPFEVKIASRNSSSSSGSGDSNRLHRKNDNISRQKRLRQVVNNGNGNDNGNGIGNGIVNGIGNGNGNGSIALGEVGPSPHSQSTSMTEQSSGGQTITIPAAVNISHNSQISKITCYGTGLKAANVHKWMDFYVDASKTKLNHLTVSIIGPTQPCADIRISYLGSQRYLVSYKSTEKGVHNTIIKWGDSHLLCSPTVIHVE